jgi:iron complex transport system substrate-binding protein
MALPTLVDPVAADISRRRFLGGAAAAGLSLGLAACGADSGSSTTTAAAADRTVSTPNGEIKVPASPSRVISINDFSLYTMLDLQVTPIGIYSAGMEYVPPAYLDRVKPLKVINDVKVAGGLDLEKIASLQPDLIIGIDAQKAPYAQLKDIAPTVLLPFNSTGGEWKAMARGTAEALGKQDDLRALDAKLKQRATKVRQDHADALSSMTFDLIQGGFDAGQFWTYGPKSNIGEVLAETGMTFAAASRAAVKDGGQGTVSYENVDRLQDADVLFYYTTNDGKPANLGPKLFALETFKRLPAVKAKRMIGSINFLLTSYGSAGDALDELDRGLGQISAA